MPNFISTLVEKGYRSCDKIGMIDRKHMFAPVLDAHPEFWGLWKEFVDEWSSEAEDLPHYLLISDVVRDCSQLLINKREDQLKNIFAVVERWIIEGEPYVKEVAIVGFIEGLQNTNLHDGTKPKNFKRFLGPESKHWWRKVERFWSHGELLEDDRQRHRAQ